MMYDHYNNFVLRSEDYIENKTIIVRYFDSENFESVPISIRMDEK